MITLQDIRAKAGDSITAKWRLLERYIDQQRAQHEQMTGAGLLRAQSGNGFSYTAVPQSDAVFHGSFWVSLSGFEATIAQGTVGDIVPAIDGERLDAETTPKLTIEGPPNEQLRSWIAIQAAADPEAENPALDAEDPEALIIVHTADLDAPLDPGVALRPVAMLVWSDEETISSVHQVLYFDQALRITKDSAGALKMEFTAAS